MRNVGLFSLGIFVFTIPWENALVFLDSVSISRVAGVVAFVCTLIYATTRGRLRAPSLLVLLCAAYVLLMIFSCLWSIDLEATLDKVPTYLQLLTMLWVVWELAGDTTAQRLLTNCYVLGCAVSVANICWNFASGNAVIADRYAADGFDPNNVALTVAISLPMAWTVMRGTGSRIVVTLRGAYFAASIFAIVLTASRGGALATLAALIIIPITVPWRRALSLFAAVAMLVTVACISIAFVPSASWNRLFTIEEQFAAGDLNHREALWRAGVQQITEHPVLGVGAAAYKSATSDAFGGGGVAHNTFLSVLVETGILGAIVFGSLLLQSARAIWNMQGERKALWATTLLTWAVGVSALSWTYQKTTWLLLVAVAAESHVVPQAIVNSLPDELLLPAAGLS